MSICLDRDKTKVEFILKYGKFIAISCLGIGLGDFCCRNYFGSKAVLGFGFDFERGSRITGPN